MNRTRRHFLRASIAASAGALALSSAGAIEPIRRLGKPQMRLSIAAYSYRKYLDLSIKPKPPMTLDDFVDLAADLGLDAIEPTSYYFADTSPAYLAKLKGRCSRLGLDISGTAVSNDFCQPDADKLKAAIASVNAWSERASLLGCKTIRIFAGKVHAKETEEVARRRCVAAIEEACDHAAKFGVFLALENHGGITETAEQTLAIVRAVKHDWFGVNLDTGNFHTADPYADLAKLAPYAVTVQIKTEVQPAGKPHEDADLKRLLDILRTANYRGYVALEYEAKEDPKTAVPRAVAELRKLMV